MISAAATPAKNDLPKGPYADLTLGELVMVMYENYTAAKDAGTLSPTPIWKQQCRLRPH